MKKPLRFSLPKEYGAFNFNRPGRQILAVRALKRLVSAAGGYEIREVVLVLCNDIGFLATPIGGDRNDLLLLHRPAPRIAVAAERAAAVFGPGVFQIQFGAAGEDTFVLKGATVEEGKYWIDKLRLFRTAQSRVMPAPRASVDVGTAGAGTKAGSAAPRRASEAVGDAGVLQQTYFGGAVEEGAAKVRPSGPSGPRVGKAEFVQPS
jgi:hypothetical protein